MIIDLNSTHPDTLCHQEQNDYNTHCQPNGYHLLVDFDEVNDDFLKAKHRSKKQYTSNGIKEFLKPLLAHYN